MMVKSEHVYGKTVVESLTFEASGRFKAVSAAEKYLKESGYVVGSMCCDEPIGFAPSDQYQYISKWWGIAIKEREKLHGVIVPLPEFREGGVRIEFFVRP